jgi:hypothetical protein
MIEILSDLSSHIDVPAANVEQKRTFPSPAPELVNSVPVPPLIRILSSPEKPDDAFAAVLLSSRGATIKNVHHIPRLSRNSQPPRTEPAVLIDGLNPFIQKRALGFVLIGFLALSFENQKVSGL